MGPFYAVQFQGLLGSGKVESLLEYLGQGSEKPSNILYPEGFLIPRRSMA
jgi:hypothetical protein